MNMNRRKFMGVSTAALLGAGALKSGFAAGEKYTACVLGDTNQGGFGHRMHLVWEKVDNVELLAISDPDEKGRAQIAKEAKPKRTYADYREMLEKEKPDFLTIGPRWTHHHVEYLTAAAEYNLHGLMEKPLAVDLAAADIMIEIIEAKNLKWSMAFNFRPTTIVQHAIKMVVEKGLIGDILELRGRGKEDHRSGGEDLLVLGTHVFDIMRYFAGDPLWCSADLTTMGKPSTLKEIYESKENLGPMLGDRVNAMYGFKDGIVGYFASSRNSDGNGGRWGLDIYGSKGIVTIRLDKRPFAYPVAYWLNDSTWAPGEENVAWQPLPDAPELGITDPRTENYLPIVTDLIKAVEQDRLPKVSMQDGRASLEMIQAVYESYLTGKKVTFPLKERVHPLIRLT